jgi:hypothetical protein
VRHRLQSLRQNQDLVIEIHFPSKDGKSNQIKSNQIKQNQIKQNQIKSTTNPQSPRDRFAQLSNRWSLGGLHTAEKWEGAG